MAARSPSRRISSSGDAATNAASPRPATTSGRRERDAQDAEDGGRVVVGRRVDLDLAGEDDLVQLALSIRSTAALDGLLVVLRGIAETTR